MWVNSKENTSTIGVVIIVQWQIYMQGSDSKYVSTYLVAINGDLHYFLLINEN